MKISYDIDVSNRIKILIKSHKIPDYLIAGLLELSPSSFSDILSGRSPWRIKYIARVAEYFGMTTDELIFGDKKHIQNFNKEQIYELKKHIKNYLVKEKKFSTYGKLQSEGYFKEIEE